MNWSILVVEGDPSTRSQVAAALGQRGLLVQATASLADVGTAAPEKPAVIVLDADQSGSLEFCNSLQSHQARPAVVLLCAGRTEEDVLRGFDAGADDILVRPFSIPELVARVMAQLRHIGSGRAELRLYQAA